MSDGGEADPQRDADDTKRCPLCAETIKAAAIKCRFCGADLTGDERNVARAPVSPTPAPLPLEHTGPERVAPTVAPAHASLSALALVGGAAVVAGAFLPWKSLGMISRSGVDGGGDGVITALFGLLVLLAAAAPLRGWRWGTCVTLGLLATAIGVFDYLAVQQQISELQASDNPFAGAMTVGSGLYATIGGGILAVLGALTAKK